MEIKVKYKGATAPKYATLGSAGADLHAATDSIIPPNGGVVLVPTGLELEIPHGYEGQVRSRSGLALKNSVFVINAPGTIDSDYRGELCVLLTNISQTPFTVKAGDRIAQIVFAAVATASFVSDAALSDTVRGRGGFGSTGV